MGRANSQISKTRQGLTVNRSAPAVNGGLTTGSTVRRHELTDTDFAIPTSRRYPIFNKSVARTSIAKVSEYGTNKEREIVSNAVESRFPGLTADGANESTLTNNRKPGKRASVVANQLQGMTFTLNAGGPRVRHEILEGRTYTVCPMVMITEGVHAGSNGPLYYPAKELSKTPAVWNHKPVVIRHPVSNGEAISACDPAVISLRKVGLIMNTKYMPGKEGKPGKLKAEAWLEMDKLKKVDPDVHKAVVNKKMVEVSTGLFTDNEWVEGRHGNKAYSMIARNYRADHLAILPDEVGACSIADGAGLMRNSSISHDDIRNQLNTQLQAANPTPKTGPYMGSPWVRDVFDTFCVYAHKNKTWSQKYDVDADTSKVSLKGTPVEVTSKQTYKTTDGVTLNTGAPMDPEEIVDALIDNSDSPFDEDDREYLTGLSVNKLQALATNAKIEHTSQGDSIEDGNEDDNGETLEDGADQVKGKKFGSRSGATKNKGKKKPDSADDDEAEPDDEMPGKGKGKGAPACNSRNRPQTPTMQEYINNAPAGLRDVLINGVRSHNQNKKKLIKAITANSANMFTKEVLAAKPIQELEALAALAQSGMRADPDSDLDLEPVVNGRRVRTANYGGLGDGAFDNLTSNRGESGGDDLPPPLVQPVINWARKGRKGGMLATVDAAEDAE